MARKLFGGLAIILAGCLPLSAGAETASDREIGVRSLSHAKTLGASVDNILMHGCYVTVGLDDGDREAIADQIAAFEGAADALRNGDEIIPALKARGPLFALDRTTAAWPNLRDFASFATHGNFDRPYLARMYDLTAPVQTGADGVTRRLAATFASARVDAYSSSTLANFDAMRADATRIAAYHCMISLDVQTEAAQAALAESIESYAKRLEIAFGGSDDALVLTASVNGVAYLRCLWRSFGTVRERLDPVADGSVTPTFTDVADLRAQLGYLVGLSDATVEIFEAELSGSPIATGECSALS
jgi:hypothetical protein